jgi:hypothetical protein
MRKHLAVPFFILCSFAAVSQKVYKPGVVVDNKGDTLRGFIGYENWRVNPKAFEFRKHEEDLSATRYDLATVQYFEISGEDAYRKAIIQKEMRPVRPEEISLETPESTQTDTVFLRVLVIGEKISLYQLVDFKDHYYVQESGDSLRELLWKFYMRAGADELQPNQVQELPIYKDQLRKYAQGNEGPSLQRQIDHARYNDIDLSKIIIAINGNGQSWTVANLSRSAGAKPYFFGSIGAGYSLIKGQGSGNPLTGLNYTGSVRPIVSVGMDIPSLRNFGEFTLRVEVAYSQFKYTGTGNSANFLGQAEYETYELQRQDIAPSLSVLYNFRRTHELNFYIGVGFAYNFSSYSTNTFTIKDMTGVNIIPPNANFDELNKNWHSFYLRFGAKIGRKFELGITGDILGDLSSYSGFTLKTDTYSLRGLYRF